MRSRYNADFPTCVDLAGITYGVFRVRKTSSVAFVIDEDGKIERAFDLYYLSTRLGDIVSGAKDPFGIDSVPARCAEAYKALKYGQYAVAAKMAKALSRSSDAEVKATAAKITAAVKQVEADWLKRMEELAKNGDAGELHEETAAYLASFPRSRNKSKLSGFRSKAKSKSRKDALAAANFARAMHSFRSSRTTGENLLRAIAAQLSGTYHGKVAATIVAALGK